MSLVNYSFTALKDTDPTGINSVAAQAVSVKIDLDDTLATIYSDSAGASPITQPGAVTDSDGVLEFWVEAGIYKIESGARTEEIIVDNGTRTKFTTAVLAAASKHIRVGDKVRIEDRLNSNFNVISGTGTANTYDIIASTQASISISLISKTTIDVKSLGIVGDGSTDNSDGIQRAFTIMGAKGGGTVLLSADNGDYRVSKHAGSNDKWGVNLKDSNVHLKIEDGASLRRLSSDITTFAKAFPILLIGVPDDNNVSSQITKIKVKGGEFIGEDTRHASAGQAPMDGRQAIWIKNTKKCTIYGVDFTAIDSGAIYEQRPGVYDEENAQYYNTTKCYNIKYIRNDFEAEEHSTNGRALIHVINTRSDIVKISHNNFEWCDVAVNSTSTYDEYYEDENDTYTDSNLATSVKRTGKGLTLSSNDFYNSSEHCLYLNGMGVSVSGGSVIVDNATVCNTNQIQIRGRNVTVAIPIMNGVSRACVINTGASDVTFHCGQIQAVGDSSGGIVSVQTVGLTAYIDARSDYFLSYKPMKNINILGGTIAQVEASQTNGVGVRVFTDTSDANFPDGQIINLNLNGVTLDNPRKAILSIAPMLRNGKISSCIFNGKAFTEAGFNGSTVMNSEYVLGADDSLSNDLINWSFDDNIVYGFEHILFDDGGAGGAGTFVSPRSVSNNKFNYIQHYSTAAFTVPTFENMFTGNKGTFFLDRTQWYGTNTILNSLSDGTSNSEKKSMILTVGAANVRLYIDDAATFVQLG